MPHLKKVLRVYDVKLSIRFKLHITKEAIKIHEFLILVYIEVRRNYSRKNGSRYPLIKRPNAPNRGFKIKKSIGPLDHLTPASHYIN